jgi:hypothetical protein
MIRAEEKQIPFGDDNKKYKGKDDSRSSTFGEG